jgi:hypothetical protein
MSDIRRDDVHVDFRQGVVPTEAIGRLRREEVFDATNVVTLKNNSTSKKSDMHPKR